MSNASSDLVFRGGGRSRPLTIRRMAQARRMRLSVDPRDGAVRLTLPKRTALRAALAWAEGHRGWIETALAGLPEPQPIAPGAAIPFEGERLTVDWRAEGSRLACREGDRLVVGGPRESLGPRVLRWLRREAAAPLDAETRAMAGGAGLAVRGVAVGDPRARWGSCSAAGDIRYSWRLILAPPQVREATVAHEVAHLRHMDHSRDFHRLVEALLGRDPAAERDWLRRHGPALYWIGRES